MVELEKGKIDLTRNNENHHLEINNDIEEVEDPDRDVSIQEIIDALESKIKILEENPQDIKEISKTLVLVCKILSVELNKSMPDDSNINKTTYIA